ncbi:histone-lysine N-methyltransferase ash1 [Coccinella septempunctata]|uniref:histone-lysine N-methyltransferase ash1 n=1 Tax=Coccinella septempunctata TaxID=41139 RepID=UPI001D07C6A7|nr:histone-lysine N-methyltransferase ash1 [Coccinella septempunctata]
MEGSEGTSQTELYTGWSSVVHQPCEDLEESELPSTVDIAAFSTNLDVEPSNSSTHALHSGSDSDSDADSSNSGSEASHSGSQSDSSESDSSSSSPDSTSRSSSPAEFSVTSSQTDGLRLTIATIKKPGGSPCEERTSEKNTDVRTASSSDVSSESEGESHSSNGGRPGAKIKLGPSAPKGNALSVAFNKVDKKTDSKIVKKDPLSSKITSKGKIKLKNCRKMTSLNRDYTYCSSDGESKTETIGDDSVSILASCSLQEIRQEDLAAILPDQQECDAFGSFERENSGKNGVKRSPEADMSDSDMELPHQAVNALIQRTTESSSESENELPNPPALYANSLLQQFEVQTQMLSTQVATCNGKKTPVQSKNDPNNKREENPNDSEKVKRRRGRPKKMSASKTNSVKSVKIHNGNYSLNPNVSPDSGIQNSPDHISSPEPTLLRGSYKEEVKDKASTEMKKMSTTEKNSTNKLSISTDQLDRHFYGHSEKTLYPPKRKVGRPAAVCKKEVPKSTRQLNNSSSGKGESKVLTKNEKYARGDKKNKGQQDVKNIKSGKLKPHNSCNEGVLKKSNTICERLSKRLEVSGKTGNKSLSAQTNVKVQRNVQTQKVTSQNKSDVKHKVVSLKNAKVMHSKHQHKIHKKRKFRILKPLAFITQDPKINVEIDKLVMDFNKLYISNSGKFAKENIPEILKTIKRVSKKRKTNEYDRKKKKQNVNTTINKIENSNEQRLPLKKRHYHISATESNKMEEEEEEKEETKTVNEDKVENKIGKVQMTKCSTSIRGSQGGAGPKPINNNNSNESDSKEVHIEEAIEACINRFSSVTPNGKTETTADVKPSEKVPTSISSITATTPKKRHRLVMESMNDTEREPLPKVELSESNKRLKTSIESVVSELKMKKSLSPKTSSPNEEKKSESVAQMITRKKNRLEDLTSNLVLKINPGFETEKKKSENGKSCSNKYPACKKTKPTELEQLDAITSSKPTGIFMPTVDIEFATSSDPLQDGKKAVTEPKNVKESEPTIVPSMNQSTEKTAPDTVKKKVRKRRAPNRTGFPTIKKKKKKIVPAEEREVSVKSTPICDRVPVDGEEYTSFLNRTVNGNNSLLSDLTPSTLDDISVKSKSSEEIGNSKWEMMSECDSLPQEERTELDLEEFQLGPDYSMREDSPTTSVDTKDSDKTTTEVDLEDLPIGKRLDRQRKNIEGACRKRRLREHSSTSSIDKKNTDDRFTTNDEKKNKKTPRWKKRYLVAGLFSDYYKEDDEATRIRRKENASKYAKAMYVPSEHPYGLLPPPYHCGKYLRCRNVAFQLPYDLWWQHTHSQLPGRDVVPSWNYRKIRTNVYNVKTTGTACELQTCNCTPSQKCGDDCINRLVLSECPANMHRCQNQKIQRHEWSPGLEKFMTDDKGWGIRTKLPIRSNDFILEYVGEVVSDQEFKERMASIYVNDTHHYCLHLDTGMVIDGHRMGGDGRFVNHSCEPNCEMQKWQVNGQFRMALFALRDIEAGEELTYDYNFSLFNPAEGQECKCGSEMCRGVIGGKSQRVRQLPQAAPKTNGGRVGRPRKVTAAKKQETKENLQGSGQEQTMQQYSCAPLKPISHQQKCYILEHHCFLLRNINKVRKVKDRAVGISFVNRPPTAPPVDHGTTFLNHLNALQKPRNMKTRRIAQAEDNPDFNRSVKVASVLKDIYDSVVNFKDETGSVLAAPFMNLPSKRKAPELYQSIGDPIDFVTVEQNIAKGAYRSTDSFDNDMNRVLLTFTKFFGCSSEHGIAAIRLKKVYQESKRESSSKFQDLLGTKPPANFVSKRDKNEEEDIIRCICGMYHDEGLMIQCERCLVWQHCECVRADPAAPSYHCEICVPREVDYEIPMDEFTEHGHRYYMTLMRGDLQLRQGDTVYVLRDIAIPGTEKKHNYQTIGKIDYNDLDIFRIERLWKDSSTGQRYAYGHHYLRPHETYHEPTRKFFQNEVMRVPLYEAVPVELIISQCWVLDLNTFCKGRPIGADEKHVYICEYRVDKSARLFHKVSKAKFPVCTKSYVFERFPERLKISRTYTPHELGDSSIKTKSRKTQDEKHLNVVESRATSVSAPKVRDLNEQKSRLNNILLKLLSKMPTKQVLDVSYLLEGGRRRKNKNFKMNQ